MALVSEATAAALWPGLDPLGQTLDLAAVPEGRSDRRLPRGPRAGHRRDGGRGQRQDLRRGRCQLCLFPDRRAGRSRKCRCSSGPAPTTSRYCESAVTTAVKEIAPEMPFQVLPMRTLVGVAIWIFQAFSVAASLLGVVGLLFAYSGTHAVVSFLVVQRTREFGIRMALGASAWRIVWGMLIETSRTGLDRSCRRVGGRGRPDRSVQRFSRDPAGLRCRSFRGGRRDHADRNGAWPHCCR